MTKEIIYEAGLESSYKSSLPSYSFNGKLIHINTNTAIFQLPKSNAPIIIPFYTINYMMPQGFSGGPELKVNMNL